MKRFWCDVETTGLNAKTSAICQLSYSFDNGVIHEKKMQPHEGADVNPEALKVGDVTEKELATFPDHRDVYVEFLRDLDKHMSKFDKSDKAFFLGYNAYFDMDFLRQWFFRNNNKFFGAYFWYPPIDVMILAEDKLMKVRHLMENFKQDSVAKVLGIVVDKEKLHDATYDIWLTREIYKRVSINEIKEGGE